MTELRTPPAAVDVAPAKAPAAPLVPRRPSSLRPEDALVTLGCAISALLLTWLILGRLTGGTGWLGFLVVWYAAFVATLYVVTRERLGALAAADVVASTVVRTGALALFVPLGLLLTFVLVEGLPTLRPAFFVRDLAGVTPDQPATDGGGLHAIVGTLEQVGLALIWTVPLGILTAVFLNETTSRFRSPVRIIVDAMSGLPSIVAGLFIYSALVIPIAARTGRSGFSGFMASLALSLVMLPTMTRTIEVVLRVVPNGLREASLALGASRARTVWSVVLPTARTGVTTAVVLGIARAVGETAPLLFTSFGLDYLNANPFRNPQESLPLFVFRNVTKPSVESAQRGYTGALVLMIVVLCLFAVARYVGRDRTRRRTRAPRTSQKVTE